MKHLGADPSMRIYPNGVVEFLGDPLKHADQSSGLSNPPPDAVPLPEAASTPSAPSGVPGPHPIEPNSR